MSATETHHPYWVHAAKEIKEAMKENGDDKMDVNMESKLETLINIEKVLKKSTGQMQQMLENLQVGDARASKRSRRRFNNVRNGWTC